MPKALTIEGGERKSPRKPLLPIFFGRELKSFLSTYLGEGNFNPASKSFFAY
jgi:hypothetical protein